MACRSSDRPHISNSILTEYAVHGIEISRVVIAGNSDDFPAAEIAQMQAICDHRKVKLDPLPGLLNLREFSSAPRVQPWRGARANVRVSSYFKWKRVMDFCAAVFLLIIFSPIIIFATLLVMAEFWASGPVLAAETGIIRLAFPAL